MVIAVPEIDLKNRPVRPHPENAAEDIRRIQEAGNARRKQKSSQTIRRTHKTVHSFTKHYVTLYAPLSPVFPVSY